jgi:formamidopyrimidine-DNA glycosylase
MPELPEVETIARRLRSVVVGKKIQKISIYREKSFQGLPETLTGATIQNITRHSKILQFHFDTPEKLLVHLKMTGQLIYVDAHTRLGGGHPTQDWIQELPSKHTRIKIQLSDDAQLFFNDLRVFGWLKVMTEAAVAQELSTLGPDIIDTAVTPAYLSQQFKKRSVPIKQVIMDNAIAAGVGNIYANDALSMARISPFRSANSLSQEEVSVLYEALVSVISRGIELGGATIHSFRHVDGFAGDYQDEVRTYGREGEPCPNCSGIIIRKKQGGRSTFYCPNCQV